MAPVAAAISRIIAARARCRPNLSACTPISRNPADEPETTC